MRLRGDARVLLLGYPPSSTRPSGLQDPPLSKSSLSPSLPQPQLTSSRAATSDKRLKSFDAVIVLHSIGKLADASELPGATVLASIAARRGDDALITGALPANPATTLVAARIGAKDAPFAVDVACRQAAVAAVGNGARKIAVVIDASVEHAAAASSAIVGALTMGDFKLAKFVRTKPNSRPALKITVFEAKKTDQRATIAKARGNCLARWLTAMPPNKLDATGYRKLTEELAGQHGWQYRFHSLAALKKRGAGAFVAVAQGNETTDAGIVQLSYKPTVGKSKNAPVALVGKGIIFDTGGTNLKPHNGMLGMHIDMGGSAVAVGSLLALSELAFDTPLEIWLAITENRTGPQAYKPQDVVTALNGKTIQTIHTDAEGRMVLADTLTLAARAKPSCILDFATLTGACMTAVTTRYSGVFTNRNSLHPLLKRHGVASGERVWPFPIGGEFLEHLKSETADIKQCAVAGGGDHILAATFLAEFVPDNIPWIHMDLSAAEHKGGLGAVATDITGFGVRYTTDLLLTHRSDIAAAKRSA